MALNSLQSKPESPLISLDDEEDEKDEDFLVSDIEESKSEDESSDSDTETCSDEADDDENSNANPGDETPRSAGQFARALAAAEALVQDTCMIDEAILTEEAYEDLFPEEEDDVGAIFASSSDEDEDEEREENKGSDIDNDSNQQDEQQCEETPSKKAKPNGTPINSPSRARIMMAGPSTSTPRVPSASQQQQATMPMSTRSRTATQSPTIKLFNDHHFPHLDMAAVPIAQRTRAHVSLMDVPMEDLEAMLQGINQDEPLLHFGVDDEFEYERFLAAVQENALKDCNGGTATDTEAENDDSDDEDFVNELRRLLEDDDDDEDGGGIGIGGRRDDGRIMHWLASDNARGGHDDDDDDDDDPHGQNRSTTKRKKKKKRPQRRSARLLGRNQSRPMYAQKIIDRHYAQKAAAPLTAPEFGLSEFAALAAAMGTSDSFPMPQVDKKVPLPSDSKELTLMAANLVTWRKPLPKAMRRYNDKKNNNNNNNNNNNLVGTFLGGTRTITTAAAGIDNKNANSKHQEQDEALMIIGANYDTSQYAQIYLLMHRHIQSLAQTYALAVVAGDEHVASATAAMLMAAEELSRAQSGARQQLGIPPYLPDFLGIGRAVQDALAAEAVAVAAATTAADAPKVWTPYYPGAVYTVVDVGVLRGVPTMIQEMPPPGSHGSQITDPLFLNQQQQAKKRQRTKPTQHAIWSRLPPAVHRALAPVRVYFNPDEEPKPPYFTVTQQMLFTPAEEELLAWGIKKHGYDWNKIHRELLPGKTPQMLFHRKKNRTTSHSASNVIKDAVALVNAPLTPAEVTLLELALDYYGKQPNKWEVICKEHLPHRHPLILSYLWQYFKKGKNHPSSDVYTVGGSQDGGDGGGGGLVQAGLLVSQPTATGAQQQEQHGVDIVGATFNVPSLWQPLALPTNDIGSLSALHAAQYEEQQHGHHHDDINDDVAEWTPDEKRLLLTMTVKHGGTLPDSVISDLCSSMKKERQDLIEKSRVFAQRFDEKTRNKSG